MLRVNFKKVEACPNGKIELYNSINPIPFSLIIGDYRSLPTTIYSRNIGGENFIEFRFDKDYHNLYEISLVTTQNNTIIDGTLREKEKAEGFYVCNIIEDSSLLEDTLPMEIERGKTSICINLVNKQPSKIVYFPISNNCSIGVDEDFNLISVFIEKLSERGIEDVFGCQ